MDRPDSLNSVELGDRATLPNAQAVQEQRGTGLYPAGDSAGFSRDPRFNRADVVDRLLPLYFERLTLYRAEGEIFDELECRRGAIMGAVLNRLGRISGALVTHPAKSLAFRMADFASFGERIAAAQGESSVFLDLLAKLEKTQARFAAEADGLVEALRLLLEQENVTDISVGDLFRKCRKIAEDNGLQIARSSQGFGRHLTNMRRVIEPELQARLIESAFHRG